MASFLQPDILPPTSCSHTVTLNLRAASHYGWRSRGCRFQSSNKIARNQEFDFLSLHTKYQNSKAVTFQDVYMAVFFWLRGLESSQMTSFEMLSHVSWMDGPSYEGPHRPGWLDLRCGPQMSGVAWEAEGARKLESFNAFEHISAFVQCLGRFLDITVQDPSVSKANRLHVNNLHISFILFKAYSMHSSTSIGNFPVILTFKWLFVKFNRFICN